MTRYYLGLLLGLLLAVSLRSQQGFIDPYCAGCHNPKLKSGGLALTQLDLPGIPSAMPTSGRKVILKLRAGMMPPSGARRPSRDAIDLFAGRLEQALDRAASAHPNPEIQKPALHRLNRAEYANSVRDLLDVDIDPAAFLPPDDMSHGFDNMAEVLTISPTLMEGYIRAAGKISRLAIGDPGMKPIVETYHVPSTVSQTLHIEGTPMGTRGGIVVRHIFPADAGYIFRITPYFTTNTLVFGTFQKGEQMDVSINGERVALLDFNPAMKVDDDYRTPPIRVKAGPQTVAVAFLQKSSGPADDYLSLYEHSLGDLFAGRTQGVTALPHVRDLGISGPYRATGISDTPSRRRILTCRPSTPADELPCARKVLTTVARQAYRRTVTETDMEDLLGAYRGGRSDGTFEDGIRQGPAINSCQPAIRVPF